MKIIPNVVTKTVSRKILVAKKNSPHIFFAAGIAGFVGTTVLACKATLKVSDPLDELQSDVADVKAMYPEVSRFDDSEIQKEYVKELGYVYGRGTLRIAKLYAPATILGAASIAALTGSHIQLTRRNAALTATLAVVSKAYDDYRERVQQELGEEKELELYRGTEEKEVNGELAKVVDPTKFSPYARIFDETSTEWQKSAEMNRMFLQCQQNYFNHKLTVYGHVFLNEVYDALGFDRTRAGAVVGWVLGDEGDNYIDFGMYEATSNRFINGIERSIVLDFNVDGVIYDKI